MQDSVREAILKNREAVIDTIKGVDPYFTNFRKVKRMQTFPQKETELPYAMLPDPAERFDRPLTMGTSGPVPTTMSNWVHAYLKNDGHDPGTDLSNAIQDVLRAWLLDWNIGGEVITSLPIRLEPIAMVERADIIGVKILFETKYRWKLHEPTETI